MVVPLASLQGGQSFFITATTNRANPERDHGAYRAASNTFYRNAYYPANSDTNRATESLHRFQPTLARLSQLGLFKKHKLLI